MKRWWVLTAVAMMPSLAVAQTPGPHPAQAGTVRSVDAPTGACKLFRGADVLPLVAKMSLMPGDRVECRDGASARLDLTNQGTYDPIAIESGRKAYPVPDRAVPGIGTNFIEFVQDALRPILEKARTQTANGQAGNPMSGPSAAQARPVSLAERLGPQRQMVVGSRRLIATGWWGGKAGDRLSVRIRSEWSGDAASSGNTRWFGPSECQLQVIDFAGYNLAACTVPNATGPGSPVGHIVDVVIDGQAVLTWTLKVEPDSNAPIRFGPSWLATAANDEERVVVAGWLLTQGSAEWRVEGLSRLVEARHVDAAQRLILHALGSP